MEITCTHQIIARHVWCDLQMLNHVPSARQWKYIFNWKMSYRNLFAFQPHFAISILIAIRWINSQMNWLEWRCNIAISCHIHSRYRVSIPNTVCVLCCVRVPCAIYASVTIIFGTLFLGRIYKSKCSGTRIIPFLPFKYILGRQELCLFRHDEKWPPQSAWLLWLVSSFGLSLVYFEDLTNKEYNPVLMCVVEGEVRSTHKKKTLIWKARASISNGERKEEKKK